MRKKRGEKTQDSPLGVVSAVAADEFSAKMQLNKDFSAMIVLS